MTTTDLAADPATFLRGRFFKQGDQWHIKDISDAAQDSDGRISFSSLDLPEIAEVDPD